MKHAGKEKKIIMKLYFGNTVTTVTTLMILALLGFIGYSVCSRAHITFWGRRSAVLLVFGLAVCCFAAARDGLDKTIQHAIDGSCAPGLFPLVSVPTVAGCIGAALPLIRDMRRCRAVDDAYRRAGHTACARRILRRGRALQRVCRDWLQCGAGPASVLHSR